jgi:hypothetical protein
MIVLNWHKRLRYSQRQADALSRCTGLKQHRVMIDLDGGADLRVVEFALHCEKVKYIPNLEVHYVEGAKGNGVNAGVLRAIDRGFEYDDFVCALEDDIIPSEDCFDFFNWGRMQYFEDPHVFSLCAFNRDPINPRWLHRCDRRPWFHSWGWATWQDRWERIRPELVVQHPKHKGYDGQINDWMHDHQMKEVYPKLARTQNIGAVGGVNTPTVEYFYFRNHNHHWAGDHVFPPGQWEEP